MLDDGSCSNSQSLMIPVLQGYMIVFIGMGVILFKQNPKKLMFTTINGCRRVCMIYYGFSIQVIMERFSCISDGKLIHGQIWIWNCIGVVRKYSFFLNTCHGSFLLNQKLSASLTLHHNLSFSNHFPTYLRKINFQLVKW